MKKISLDFLGGNLYILTPEDKDFDTSVIKKGESCYVLAGNGLFTVDRSEHQVTVRKTTGVGLELSLLEEGTRWVGRGLDRKTYSFLDALFRAVYEKHQSEAVVLLYLDKNNEWVVRVPEQTVGSASARWRDGESAWYRKGVRLDKKPEDLTAAGSAHSHAAMGAFFSATDDKDDLGTSGLHLVFGNYGKRDLAARATGGGQTVELDPGAVVEFSVGAEKVEVPDLIKPATTQATPSGRYYHPGVSWAAPGYNKRQDWVPPKASPPAARPGWEGYDYSEYPGYDDEWSAAPVPGSSSGLGALSNEQFYKLPFCEKADYIAEFCERVETANVDGAVNAKLDEFIDIACEEAMYTINQPCQKSPVGGDFLKGLRTLLDYAQDDQLEDALANLTTQSERKKIKPKTKKGAKA